MKKISLLAIIIIFFIEHLVIKAGITLGSYFEGIDDDPFFPINFKFGQNYFNPFNPATTIKYQIPDRARNDNVYLKVFDVLGREVKTLLNKTQLPGNYEITFDASKLPSGVYYYQLKSGEFLDTRKMLLLK